MSLLEQLHRQRLLAIVRAGDPGTASAIVDVLADEGIDLVEVSLTTVDALSVIRRAAAGGRGADGLGAGTVLTAADAQAAVEAGASYLVTPGISEGAREGVRLGVPVLVGALTPSEVIAAVELGATAVKLFPVAQLGGPSYVRALRAPFPDVPFIAVGGVALLVGLVLGFVLTRVRTRWCPICGEHLRCAACEQRRGAWTHSTGRLGA